MGGLGSFGVARLSVNQNYDAQGDYHNTVTSSLTGTTNSEYDVNGNLIAVTSPRGTVNYAYDPAPGEREKATHALLCDRCRGRHGRMRHGRSSSIARASSKREESRTAHPQRAPQALRAIFPACRLAAWYWRKRPR